LRAVFFCRKSRKNQKNKQQTGSINEITPGGSEDNTERNETSLHEPTAGEEEDNDQSYITRESRQSETDVHISDNGPSTSLPEDPNLSSDNELEDDELADWGDDSAAGGASLTQSPLSRRKLKMVLDKDDEDD
jgi:timeless